MGQYLTSVTTTRTNLDFLSHVNTVRFFEKVDQLWQQFFLDVLQQGRFQGKVFDKQQEFCGQHAALASHQSSTQVQEGKESEATNLL